MENHIEWFFSSSSSIFVLNYIFAFNNSLFLREKNEETAQNNVLVKWFGKLINYHLMVNDKWCFGHHRVLLNTNNSHIF